MIVTVASYKGGVGKTTSAVHLAGYLQSKAPTLLIDGDPNRSATGWAKRGQLPFQVVDERQAARVSRDFEHIVIDTKARPEREDLEALVAGCDLLIIPSTPDTLALEALVLTLETLRSLGTDAYRVLLTVIPPRPNKQGDEARAFLIEAGFPLFNSGIPRLVAFQDAATQGMLVQDIKKSGAKEGAEAYAAVGREILV